METAQKPSNASAEPAGHPLRIAAAAFLVLLLELALIRFIPSEVRAISYFTNLILFSAFFGIGLGCILYKRELPEYLATAGFLLVFAYVVVFRGIVVYDAGGDVHYWLQPDDQRAQPLVQIPLFLAAVVVFIASSAPFVATGWQLAREMQRHERLKAYGLNLLGSLLGVVLFSAASYAGCPPWAIIAAAGIAWALIFCRGRKFLVLQICAALLFIFFAGGQHSRKWSPYYLVQYDAGRNRITVWVNSSFHQEAINFRTDDPIFKDRAADMEQKFGFPYRTYRKYHDGSDPRKVLILGPGAGNDVCVALLNGVKEITAVEIDPVIAGVGRDFNMMRPYQDPAVRLVIDDGRHFLASSEERYDMIVFGTLDSQTLLSGYANLRLDNYLYTKECFGQVKKLLKPDGMFAAYYSVSKSWFFKRIYSTVASAFPGKLQMFRYHDNYLFNTIIIAAEGLPGFNADAEMDRNFGAAVPSTDDWPFIYMEKPSVPALYMKVFALIGAMIAAVFLLLRREEKSSGLHLDFFFLGAGFSLVESAAIVRLSLAFGSTWTVNAIVFAAVLLTLFSANFALLKLPRFPLAFSWAALLASLAVNFFFPVAALLELGLAARVCCSMLLTGLPVFFSGLVFSSLFKRTSEVGFPFGINMVGAMAGGAVEYVSMLLGLRMIWLVLIAVYCVALVCSRTKKEEPFKDAACGGIL